MIHDDEKIDEFIAAQDGQDDPVIAYRAWAKNYADYLLFQYQETIIDKDRYITELRAEVARLWEASPRSRSYGDDGMLRSSTHRMLKEQPR